MTTTMIRVIVLIAMSILPLAAHAQLAIAIEMIVTQKGDQGVDLKATVTDEENSEPVKGLTLQFTGTSGDKTVVLGEATTNAAGIAELKGASLDELRTAGHTFRFTTSFAGTEQFLKNEASVDIVEVNLVVKVETIDSVNTITVTTTSWNEKGEEVPFKEGEVKLYVPRMFSLLPIGDITTEEEGSGTFEFPADLPGGANGELTVIARIEEHETFANVETSAVTAWGLKADVQASKLPRTLWSPDAPLWMVITFVILMVGVWYHYALIVYELIKVKRLSKREDKLDYSE